MSEELASNRGSYKPQKISTKDFEARMARDLSSAYIYHSCSPASMHLWSSISAASCQGTFFPKQKSSTLLFIVTSLQKPSCIWQNCNSLPKTPLQLDTLALIVSCSYSDPLVVHYRLVHVCKTKLY